MRFAPSSLRHLVWADIISLNAVARPVLRLGHPLVLPVRCRTVAKVRSLGWWFGCVSNAQQENHRMPAARRGLWSIWRRPCRILHHMSRQNSRMQRQRRHGFQPASLSGHCCAMPCRPMDVVQVALCLILNRFRHRVQHIARFVEPAALFFCRTKDLAQGIPEAQGTIRCQAIAACSDERGQWQGQARG